MPKTVTGAPAWACEFLRKAGYSPQNVMDPYVAAWWRWYAACDEFYQPERTATEATRPRACQHMTLFPARMAADEWAGLVMDEKTVVSSPDPTCNEWIAERLGADFVATGSDELALAFALGFGVWAANFGGIADDDLTAATATVDFYDAGQVVPLLSDGGESVSVALVSRVLVGGRAYDRVQVHEPDQGTGGTYHLRTWLFDPKRRDSGPVGLDAVIADLDTGSTLPTYCMVSPAIANAYEDATPCGVSVFADAIDAIRLLDETFDGAYWRTRLCQPRMVVDEAGLAVDPATGQVRLQETIDQRLFKSVRGAVGQQVPVTVFAPDMQAEDTERAINNALSVFSAKCGLGPNYWSFTRAGVNKTAREVVSDNSQLMRNCRRHERAVGAQLRRLVAGTFCAEVALRTGAMPEPPEVEVAWDDSVVEDTEAERAMMKDDIARGLCPAWLYPMRFYGMDEDAARALVGQAAFPEEL